MKSLSMTLLVNCLCLAMGAATADAQVVDIPDPGLREAIEKVLGKSPGTPITADDMGTLTYLEERNANISNLTGLEFAINLSKLNLGPENVAETWVNSNTVSDLSPLAELTKLITLNLDENLLSDISPLTKLTNLTWLNLDDNLLSDISPLTKLTNLTWLALDRNLISDISPLAGLTKLRDLWLDGNSILNLSPLVGLTNLGTLTLEDNAISDISPLAGLTKLKNLRLRLNSIRDLLPLAKLTNLRTLNLEENSIRDLLPLAELINLRTLNLGGNLISDLSPLVGLADLAELHLHYNSLSDISPLMGLTNLTGLLLRVNSISDISPLTGLTNLRWLKLDYNSISDLSPLAGLTNLTKLHLEENSISDLSPLVLNTGLGEGDSIAITGNPLNDTSINTHIPALLSRGIVVDEVTVDRAEMNQAKLFFPTIAPVAVSDTFALNLTVEDITDLAGWQLDIAFNPAVLKAVSVTEGDFLSKDGGSTFFQAGSINNTTGAITGLIAARISAGGVSGTGILLSINFEAKAAGEGGLNLHEVRLGDTNGDPIPHELVINPITVEGSWDVNGDGQINVFDLILVAQSFGQANPKADVNNDGTVNILDLIVVAQRLGESTTGLAPSGLVWYLSGIDSTTIQSWIDMAYTADDGSLTFRQGIANLKHLLEAICPDKTALLANYPNPFNPETWIPYHLANDANVTLTIYDTKGTLVRQFSLGYQQAGYYADRAKAAYWDGRNEHGESVASGVYFYQLQTGDYSAMRKMVILK